MRRFLVSTFVAMCITTALGAGSVAAQQLEQYRQVSNIFDIYRYADAPEVPPLISQSASFAIAFGGQIVPVIMRGDIPVSLIFDTICANYGAIVGNLQLVRDPSGLAIAEFRQCLPLLGPPAYALTTYFNSSTYSLAKIR